MDVIKRFLYFNKEVGMHFKKTSSEDDLAEEDFEDVSKEDSPKESTVTGMWELRKKSISQAVLVQEVTEELYERGKTDEYYFGPMVDNLSQKVSFKESIDQFMTEIDEIRKMTLYSHDDCSDSCKRRGCGMVASVDGLWKLSYPICMWENNFEKLKDIQEFVPNVCSEPPAHGRAFCMKHSEMVENLGHPSGLREFIKKCGADPNSYNKEGLRKVQEVIKSFADSVSAKLSDDHTVGDSQGTKALLTNKHIMKRTNFQIEEDDEDHDKPCRKDIGDKMQLRRRSRGVEVFVTGGGIIRQWAPIYKVMERKLLFI